jgi:hypothetical protein
MTKIDLAWHDLTSFEAGVRLAATRFAPPNPCAPS